MKKQITYIVLTFIGAFWISCETEEFLNPLPDTVVTVETFFRTDADVLAGIIGIYDALQGVNENTETNITRANRGIQFEHLLTEHRTDNTRNATLEGSKSDFHRYVVEANNVESEDYYQSMYEVIFRANNILDFIDVADESNRAKYTAEAKFLRAYAYFKLVRLFGDVPLVTSVISPLDEEAAFTRVSTTEIYDQIIADLQEAANVLDNSFKARASRAAAQGILAKVYLTLDDPNYEGARQLTEAIINSGDYSLMTSFEDVYYAELNNEIIFAIQFSPGNPNESQSFSSEFTSGSRRQGREDGQNIVNENLITDFIAFGGERTPVSFITFPDGVSEVAKYLPAGTDLSNLSSPTYGGTARDAGNDYIALRYADVLLMHVEAILAGSPSTSDAAATDSFQKIRDRAFPETAPNQISSISRQELLLERRVEFAFENQRYFDLKRFGVLDEVLSDHAEDMGYVYDPRKARLLPIPAREINLSDGRLTQNPGY